MDLTTDPIIIDSTVDNSTVNAQPVTVSDDTVSDDTVFDDHIYSQCEEIVDAVVEMIGRKYHPAQIRRALREIDPNITLKTCNHIIMLARRRILALYQIDPNQFKGEAIEFYSSVIRNDKMSIRYKLVAQERLDKLLGLEHISLDDPKKYITSLNQALREMESLTGAMKSDR